MGSSVTVQIRSLVVATVLAGLLLSAQYSNAATLGELSMLSGPAGCIDELGVDGCTDGKALDGAIGVTVSPDGRSVYVASATFVSDAVAIFDRDTSTGALTQKSGTAGCISETGAGPCVDGKALDGAEDVTVSPDGRSVYVASYTSSAVAIFDRDTSTGALTQKPDPAGCISETGAGPCVDGKALGGAIGVTVSPDGRSVYVASAAAIAGDAVTIFDRDTSTGALTQKPGTAGCISDTGSGGECVDGRALAGASDVTVSPDGRSVYVASLDSGAVAIFDRDTSTGALTQKSGTAGCISDTGSGGECVDGRALDRAADVTVSPDGRSVYVTSYTSDAVTIFKRHLPLVSLSSSSLSFSSTIGKTSAAQQLTATNSGDADLVFGTSSLSGTGADYFFLQSDGCQGQTVAAGATCSVSVAFTAGQIAASDASLVLDDNASDSPQSVSLSGSGKPDIKLKAKLKPNRTKAYPLATFTVTQPKASAEALKGLQITLGRGKRSLSYSKRMLKRSKKLKGKRRFVGKVVVKPVKGKKVTAQLFVKGATLRAKISGKKKAKKRKARFLKKLKISLKKRTLTVKGLPKPKLRSLQLAIDSRKSKILRNPSKPGRVTFTANVKTESGTTKAESRVKVRRGKKKK